MRRLLPLLVAAALGAGCSNRERLNPLDPANALTRGAPQGFVAVAGDGLVQLSWQGLPPDLVLGYRIFRSVGGGAFDSLTDLPAKSSQYLDAGLANNIDYTYSIAYVLDGGGLSAAASDVATPGRTRAWVVDLSAGSLSRLTPDGRHVADVISGPFRAPSALDVDPGNGQVWVCDNFTGQLWRVTPGMAPASIGSFSDAVSVALDRLSQRAWVCDQTAGELQSLDLANSGAHVFTIPGLAQPLSVAVDAIDGSAWVCERSGDRVRHIALNGTPMGSATVATPSRVAVDSTTRRIWVTSYSSRRVFVLSGSAVPIDTIEGLAGPVGVTVDPRSGRAWVADTGGDRVITYDRNRAELFRVTGLPAPLEVGVDRATGQAWVPLAEGGEVVRISPDGRILSRAGGFQQPYNIAVEQRP
jgi:DNA-binding beta-propeller fold protein YncE